MRNTVFAALAAAAPLAAQDMIAVTWSGAVYAIDSFTGASTSIGFGLSGQNALARDQSGALWSTYRDPANNYSITLVDPSNGSSAVVWPSVDLRGLANAGGGQLFGIRNASPDELVLVDTSTGQITTIGPTGFTGIQSLARVDGVLYAWDVNAELLVVDPSTGTATDVNPTGQNVNGDVQWLARRADGRLVGGNNTLFEIDPGTGVATLIGGAFPDTRGAEPFQQFVGNFGVGCDGAGGQVTSSASIGSGPAPLLTVQSTNHAPNAPGIVVFGFRSTDTGGVPLPIPVDPIFGTVGCTLYVSLDVSLFATTTASAPATLDLQLPVQPGWSGQSLLVQHAVLENVPGGLSLSDATVVQFGF